MIRATTMLLLLLACGARAQDPKHAEAAREAAQDKARTVPGGASKGVVACHEDIERWCKDVVAGEGRIGACLKSHKAKLSKKCRRWADHGGKQHSDEAYLEIDRQLTTPKVPPK